MLDLLLLQAPLSPPVTLQLRVTGSFLVTVMSRGCSRMEGGLLARQGDTRARVAVYITRAWLMAVAALQ